MIKSHRTHRVIQHASPTARLLSKIPYFARHSANTTTVLNTPSRTAGLPMKYSQIPWRLKKIYSKNCHWHLTFWPTESPSVRIRLLPKGPSPLNAIVKLGCWIAHNLYSHERIIYACAIVKLFNNLQRGNSKSGADSERLFLNI